MMSLLVLLVRHFAGKSFGCPLVRRPEGNKFKNNLKPSVPLSSTGSITFPCFKASSSPHNLQIFPWWVMAETTPNAGSAENVTRRQDTTSPRSRDLSPAMSYYCLPCWLLSSIPSGSTCRVSGSSPCRRAHCLCWKEKR